MYLLDKNVISEVTKKQPNERVLGWLGSVNINSLYLSVLTLGEIRKGVENIDNKSKQQKIVQWLEIELVEKFHDRIISIDARVADKWGYISSLTNIPAIDGLIAASALVHNLTVVTRNTKDFKDIIGLETINPWEI